MTVDLRKKLAKWTMPAMSVSLNSTRRLVRKVAIRFRI
jgi:hypothetical protein